MKTSPAAPWVRLGFISVLALVCIFNPSWTWPAKAALLVALVLPLALTLIRWHAARRGQAPSHDDAGTK